jgi:hypothetical protein
MATYVNDLRLTELATGEGSGTWGTTTNTSLELIGEALGYATQQAFGSDADATTTVADGASDPARAMYYKITSAASLTATRTLTIAPNTISRVMFIENATSGSQSIAISQGSGASVTILTGKTAVVYLDGAGATAAVVDAMAGVDPGVTDTLTEVLVAGNTSGGTNIELSTTDKVQFRDTGIYINSSVDGQLDIVADTEIQIAATTIDVNGTLAFDSLKGTGATTVTNILDEDNMASDSATAIATQQSIKAYVDSQVGSFDTLAEVLAQGNTTGGTDLAVSTGDDITFADNSKAIFGAGSDLQIYSDGTTGQVTGNVNVTGTVTADGLTVDGTTATIQDDSANLRFENSAGARTGYIQNRADAFEIWDDQATPMIFGTSNAERLRIDAAGNAGLGVTPEAWTAFNPVLRIKNASTGGGGALAGSGVDNFRMFANTYYDGAYKRLDTGFATQYGQESGQHVWSTAATGAGASTITWSESMRIDASGNVGIGTSSPQSTYKLTISGTDSVFPSVYLENTTNSKAYSMRATGTSWIIRDNTVGADRLNIDTSGNVGIGTDSPQEKTHSAGRILSTTQYGAPTQRIGTSIGENGNTRADIDFRRWTGAAANHGVGMIDVSDTGVMAFYTDTKTSNTPATTERMRIDASGNVGIGSVPDSWSALTSLDISQSASFAGHDSQNAAYFMNNLYFNGSAWIAKNTGTSSGIVLDDISGHIAFYQNASASADTGVALVERMRIDASGNVGIGVVPNAWGGTTGLQLSTGCSLNGSSVNAALGANSYYDGVNYKYITSNPSTNYYSNYANNGSHVWQIAPSGTAAATITYTNAMTLDASGNLLVGSTDADAGISGTPTNPPRFSFKVGNGEGIRSSTTGSHYWNTLDDSSVHNFRRNGADVGSISVSTGATAYNTSSDQRLKENIADADDAGSKIDAIQVRKFDWKVDGSHQDYGMVAQELQVVAPEAVHQPADSEEMMGVDYSKLVPMMLKEIQSLRARIAALES